MEDCSEVVEAGDVVVAELWEMGDAQSEVLDGFFEVLIFDDGILFFFEPVMHDVERQI